jgi:outer membrane lipoprotein-sorting protein
MLRTLTILLLFAARPLFAEESATTLARKAEAMIFASPGVQMTFNTPQEGTVKLRLDLKGKHIRIESNSTVIVSDGSTVKNLSKTNKRMTIDNVAKTNSPFADPASLFRLSENYTSTLIAHKGKSYTLELTPNKTLAALMKAAGDAQKLTLTVVPSGKTAKITEASIASSKGTQQTNKLKITSIKHVNQKDFLLIPEKGVQILDLRE